MGRLGRIWRFCAIGVFCGQGVWAPGAAQELQSKQFEDWQVICEAAGPQTECQMLQSARAGAQSASVFLLSISPGPDLQQSYAVMTVPVGVYLRPGVEIHIDRRRPFKVLYEICDTSGCHAGFKLSGPVLEAFRQGLDAKVRVWTAQDKAVDFPVSLRGFSAGFQYYKAEISG